MTGGYVIPRASLATSTETSATSTSTVASQRFVPDVTADMQTQRMFKGNLLPWNTRNLQGVVRLLMAWIAALIPTSLQTPDPNSTYVIKPDRDCDFLEHWWVTHMKVTLKYLCIVAGCNSLHKLFKTVSNFTQHLQTHFPGVKTSDPRISKPISDCLNDFCDHASDEPDAKLVANQVHYLANHVGATQFMKIKAEEDKARKSQEEQDAKVAKARKEQDAKDAAREARRLERIEKDQVEEERKAADRACKTEDSRRAKDCANHHRSSDCQSVPAARQDTTGNKRAAGATVTHTEVKKARPDCFSKPLTIDARDDRLPMDDITTISGAFGSLQAAYGIRLRDVITEATKKMESSCYERNVVWQELNGIQNAMNFYRDDIDLGARAVSQWQTVIDLVKPQTKPLKVLAHATTARDAARVKAMNELLRTANEANLKLTKALRASNVENASLRVQLVAAPPGAVTPMRALAPMPLDAPRWRLSLEMWADEAEALQANLTASYRVVGTMRTLP